MNLTTAQVCSALGVTYLQLLSLMNNAAFPAPLTNDFAGDMTFDPTAIANFGSLMADAASNGWNVQPDNYPSANWQMMSTTQVGAYRPSPGGIYGGRGAGLFD